MGVVIFNGISSQDYGIQVATPPGYVVPEKDYESTHVPGRNGDVIIDHGSYKNVSRSYIINIGDEEETFVPMAQRITEWTHSGKGYCRLEDTYEPEIFRLAQFKSELSIGNIWNHGASASISFDCKPQRFLKLGEEISSTNGQNCSIVLRNPTIYEAKPLISIKGAGNGTLSVNGAQYTISTVADGITIDSEHQDCYYNNMNRNKYISMNYNEFPVLVKGENTVALSWSTTNVTLEVIPRWWTL